MMTEFDIMYENVMKSLMTAGLIGSGAVGSYSDVASYNSTPPVVKNISDDQIINKTLPVTKWAEGFRGSVYKDSKGIPTVGYGFNLNSQHIIKELENFGYSSRNLISRNEVLREKDAEIILKRLMEKSLNESKQFVNNFDELDPIAQIVLLDMTYNLGLTKLSKFNRFKSALEREDYKSAKAEMIDSKWYSDVGRRSRRLVQLMDAVADRT